MVAYSEDKGNIATVPEFPGFSAFGDTEEEAIKEVIDTASLWLSATRKARCPISEPIVKKKFKGGSCLSRPSPDPARCALLPPASITGAFYGIARPRPTRTGAPGARRPGAAA